MIIEKVSLQIENLRDPEAGGWYVPRGDNWYNFADLDWLEGKLGFLDEFIQQQMLVLPMGGNIIRLSWMIGDKHIFFDLNFSERSGQWNVLSFDHNIDSDFAWEDANFIVRNALWNKLESDCERALEAWERENGTKNDA